MISLTTLSCKKGKDYRDPYLGEFNFKVNKHIFNYSDSTFHDTIIYYSGAIAKGDCSIVISINFLPGYHWCFEFNENNNTIRLCTLAQGFGANGKFERTDQVKFIYFIMNGTVWHVEGNRK